MKSGRGGKRNNAGRRPKWKHGKTKMIRVPENLADEILIIAHRIDDGLPMESNIINLSGISINQIRKRKAVLLGDLLTAGYEITPLALAKAVRDEVN